MIIQSNIISARSSKSMNILMLLFFQQFLSKIYMGEAALNDETYTKRKVIATTIASPLASLIAKFVTYPIDTIKTKIQADTIKLHSLSSYKVGHSLELTRQIFQKEGIKGFFPGVTITSFGSIIAFSAYMTVYEKAKLFFQKFEFFNQYSAVNHLFSGFCAEFASCVFWLPIDIIKERMQVQSVVKLYTYDGPRDAMKKIHNTQGLIGLYRAFGATLVFFGPWSGIFFMTYQKLKHMIVKDPKNQSMTESIICSSGAGAFSGFITTPLEMVKMRMQIQRADSAMKGIPLHQTLYGYRNIFHGIYLVTQKEGAMALYKGAGLRVLFVVPLTTLTFTLTEQFRRLTINSKLPDYFM